jgi:hypothetical protein
MKVKELNRAVSVTELMTTRHRCMEFEGKWLDSFGKPELTGSWLIWGNSGNGKTRFALQLCKYLTNFGRVAYNSLEEGAGRSMQAAFSEVGMDDVKRRIVLLDQEPISELIERLKRRKSPDIIAIDSIQYTGMNYADYKALRNGFRGKLFLLISHAAGTQPAGRVATSIRFDAFVKVRVEGYRAFPVSRYGGGDPFTIWDEGAFQYWGT